MVSKSSITKLWENNSELSPFSPQDLSIDLEKYHHIIIDYRLYTRESGFEIYTNSNVSPVIGGKNTLIYDKLHQGENWVGRIFSISEDKKSITFYKGFSTASETENNCIIPIAIYGIN